MRTRIIILTLVATAASLTSCGLNSSTGFEGKAGSATSKAKAEATYMAKVKNALPSDVLDTISNDDILSFGHGICDKLDDGAKPKDIFDGYSQKIEDTDDAEELTAIVRVATMADLAMKHLCPELS